MKPVRSGWPSSSRFRRPAAGSCEHVDFLPAPPSQEDVPPKVGKLLVDRAQPEADFPQERAPFRARKKTQLVTVVHQARLASSILDQDREVDQVVCVARIRIGDPL